MSLVQPKDEDGGKALSPYDNYVVGKSRKIITTGCPEDGSNFDTPLFSGMV